MWIVRNMYFDKGVKYVRLHGHLNFAEGGAAHDVIEGIKKYGIVTPGGLSGSELRHGETGLRRARRSTESLPGRSYQGKKQRVLTTAWQDGLNRCWTLIFGVRPEKFTYEVEGIYPRIVRSVAADQDGRLCRRRFLHAPSVLHGVHHRSPRQLDVGHGLQRTAGDDGRGR